MSTHAQNYCLSAEEMGNKADPPSSSPPPSLSDYRWSRDEIPLPRREGQEVLARRVRRPRTPPLPTPFDYEVYNWIVCVRTCPAP